MNTRVLTVLAGVAACGLLLKSGLKQREMNQLRVEQQKLILEIESTRMAPIGGTAEEQTSLQHVPAPAELLRLRGEVSQLMERQKALAYVRSENEALRAKLNRRATNSASVPFDYIRKRDAQWVGMNTPENTLQSFLWAIHNRKPDAILQLLAPTEASLQFSNHFSLNHDEFFDSAAIPGARATSKQTLSDGSVLFKIEFVPGESNFPGSDIRFQNYNGEWKMDLR